MATNNNNPFGDFYSDMLEMDPQMAYLGTLTNQSFGGINPVQQKRARDYFANQYSNIYNEYMAKKGREYQQKVDPAEMTTFSDFLSDIPFTTRYAQLTPYQRGMSSQRFAPSTRYIFY